MNRDQRTKLLDCAVCGRPTPVGAEAVRVLCQDCAAAGESFPQDEQLEFFERLAGKQPPDGKAERGNLKAEG